MKKRLLISILIAASAFAAHARSDGLEPRDAEKIVYFEQNGRFGAKTALGRVVVPAQYGGGFFYQDGDAVEDELLFMDKSRAVRGSIAYSPFFLHSRQGRFLYRPMMYDTGADYFSEGRRRYVSEEGKVGFADRAGNLAIPARHDWVEPFEYGYAAFCDGCREEYIDDEHTVVRGGTWGVMDARGQTVRPGSVRRAENDIERDGKFYPHPFAYNAAETDILQRFNRYKKLIVALRLVNVSPHIPQPQRAAYRFEIVSQPVQGYPYYEIALFDDKGRRDAHYGFLAGADGKQLYVLPIGEEKPQPLEPYLQQEILAAFETQSERRKNGASTNNPFDLKDYPEAAAWLKRRK